MTINQFSTDNAQSDQNQIDCERYNEADLLGQPDDDRDDLYDPGYLPEIDDPKQDDVYLLSDEEMVAAALYLLIPEPTIGYLETAKRLLTICNSREQAEKIIDVIFSQ